MITIQLEEIIWPIWAMRPTSVTCKIKTEEETGTGTGTGTGVIDLIKIRFFNLVFQMKTKLMNQFMKSIT